MPSAAHPVVMAALLRVVKDALDPVRVIRGRDLSGDPSDIVLIGRENVDDLDWSSSGSFRQAMQAFGGSREEAGAVNSLIIARNGDADQDAVNATAFGYLALIEAAVRADSTLGITTLEYIVAEIDAGDVLERQGDDGATAALRFIVAYKARI